MTITLDSMALESVLGGQCLVGGMQQEREFACLGSPQTRHSHSELKQKSIHPSTALMSQIFQLIEEFIVNVLSPE